MGYYKEYKTDLFYSESFIILNDRVILSQSEYFFVTVALVLFSI